MASLCQKQHFKICLKYTYEPAIKNNMASYRPSSSSFQNIARSISRKEGVPMKNAGAILASATRRASPAAKRKNPNLKKVK